LLQFKNRSFGAALAAFESLESRPGLISLPIFKRAKSVSDQRFSFEKLATPPTTLESQPKPISCCLHIQKILGLNSK
jgi:hypothetical protein